LFFNKYYIPDETTFIPYSIGEQTTYSQSETSNQPYPPSSTDLLLLEKGLDRHIREEILYDKATDTQA